MRAKLLIYQKEDETFEEAYHRQRNFPNIIFNRENLNTVSKRMKTNCKSTTKVISIPVQIHTGDRTAV